MRDISSSLSRESRGRYSRALSVQEDEFEVILECSSMPVDLDERQPFDIDISSTNLEGGAHGERTSETAFVNDNEAKLIAIDTPREVSNASYNKILEDLKDCKREEQGKMLKEVLKQEKRLLNSVTAERNETKKMVFELKSALAAKEVRLDKALEEVKEARVEKDSANLKCVNITEELNEITKTNIFLNDQLVSRDTEISVSTENDSKVQAAENVRLQAEKSNHELKTELDLMRNTLKERENAILMSAKDNEMLKQDKLINESKYTEVMESIKKVKEGVDILQRCVKEKEDIIEATKEDLAKLKGKCDRSTAGKKEVLSAISLLSEKESALKRELEEKDDEIAGLRKVLARQEVEVNNEKSMLREKVDIQERDLGVKITTIERMAKEYAIERENLFKDNKNSLNRELEEKDNEIDGLRKMLACKEVQLRNEKSMRKEKEDSHKRDLGVKIATIERIAKEFAIEKENMLKDNKYIYHKLSMLKAEHESLMKKYAAVDQELCDNQAEIVRIVAEMEKEKSRLNFKCTQVEEKYTQAHDDVNIKSKEIFQLKESSVLEKQLTNDIKEKLSGLYQSLDKITREKELEKMEMGDEIIRLHGKINEMKNPETLVNEDHTSASSRDLNGAVGIDNDLLNVERKCEDEKNLTMKKLTNKCELLQNMISVMHLKVKDSLLSMESAERAVCVDEDVGKETVEWIEREIAALKKDTNIVTDGNKELDNVCKYDIRKYESFGEKPNIITGIAVCLTLASILQQWQ